MRLLVFVLSFLTLAGAAVAQDTTISAQPFVELLMPILQAVLVAAVPILVGAFLQRTKIQVDAAHRDAFQVSLANAAGLLLQKVGSTASTATIDVRSPAMAEAIRYVQTSAPDAIKKWGITPEAIAEKVVAKIGVLVAAK